MNFYLWCIHQNLTDKRRKSWIHLEEPIKAEFKRYWKFPQRSIQPNKGTELRSFTQWQNYAQLEGETIDFSCI